MFFFTIVSPGGISVLDELMKDEKLSQQPAAVEGMQDLKVLLQYCELYKISDKVCQIICMIQIFH